MPNLSLFNKSTYLPGPSNFNLQSEGTTDASTSENTNAASREQPMHTDLRDKLINATGEEGSQTIGRANVQALEDSETEGTD